MISPMQCRYRQLSPGFRQWWDVCCTWDVELQTREICSLREVWDGREVFEDGPERVALTLAEETGRGRGGVVELYGGSLCVAREAFVL